jgi:transcriptional regulator with XRE-family HTH domain
MIKNDKQLKITKGSLLDFRNIKEKLEADATIDQIKKKISLNSINGEILAFEKDIDEYQRLKAKQISSLHIEDFNKFSEILIKSRIAKGWTQAELAEKINVKEQQIQRYEATNYETASLARIDEIIYALKITTRINVVGLCPNTFKVPNGTDLKAIEREQNKLSNIRTLIPTF